MAVEFGLLGDVEARVDGEPVDLGHARQRCVLVALLVEANRPVSVDQLVDRVWGESPPRRVRDTLYGYLYRLRQALASAPDVEIARRSGGYVLTVEPMAVDTHRFDRLVAEARGEDDERALELLERAIGLWRGEAFANLDTPWLNALREKLGRQRLAAELRRNDLALRQGRHEELVAELAARVEDYPLDEHLTGQYLLALCRCGRQAEALAHFERTRARLTGELGTDPGPALRRLHQEILTGDAALAPPAAASTRLPVPRQLPAPPWLFTGRVRELAELGKALDRQGERGTTVVVSAIGGTAGVGKTWLALHWAHENLARFPDGQLYVDLRGFDPGAEPVPPSAVLRNFLAALGVGPDAMPADAAARGGLFRSMVADRRMLVMLDNARDTGQVLPLLPGSPSCTVLVTSRRSLAGLATLHGARPLALDVLPGAESYELLARHVGAERLAAEPDAAGELLDHCGGLPLAISIVGARAAARPDFPLATLAEELRTAAGRLDALDTGELSADLRAVFAASDRALAPDAAALFRLLGLVPGPDIDLTAAAALAGLPAARARALLRDLESSYLVGQHRPGRYGMHDLVRLHAAESAERTQPAETRDAARLRLVDFYTHSAHAADHLLDPHQSIALGPPVDGCVPRQFPDFATAMAWFDTEHTCLLAAQRLAGELGWHDRVWQLAWVTDMFHWRRGHLRDHLASWRAGLAAAEHLGDASRLGLAHRRLGMAHMRLGDHRETVLHLGKALEVFERGGDVVEQAHTQHALAYVWDLQGDTARALVHAERSLDLHRVHGDPKWEANALNSVGWYEIKLGRHGDALEHCEHALALCRLHGYREGEAATVDSLGRIAHVTGRHAAALSYYEQALALRRELGETFEEADALACLGEVLTALGRPQRARTAWQQALRLYRAQHRTGQVEDVQRKLAELDGVDEDRDRPGCGPGPRPS